MPKRVQSVLLLATVFVALVVPDASAGASTTTFGSAQCVAGGGSCDGIAVNASGDVYATDYGTSQVFELGPSGSLLSTWGTFGASAGSLEYPDGIAVDASGNVWVTDTTQTQEFSPTGTSIRTFGSGTGGEGLALDGSGDVYVTQGTGIHEYSSAGSLLSSWSMGTSGLPSGGNLVSIATDPSHAGGFYAVDEPGNRILEFSSSGTYTQTIGSQGSGNGQFENPTAIAVDGNGSLYVADMTSLGTFRIQELASDGSFVSAMAYPSPEVTGLSVSGNELYVAHFWAGLDRVDLNEPIPALAATPTSPMTSQSVTFDASQSSLPFGTITDYRWDLNGSGTFSTDTGTTPTVSTFFTQPGPATVSVEVTGSTGQTATASVVVNVVPSPDAISAPASALTGHVERGDPVPRKAPEGGCPLVPHPGRRLREARGHRCGASIESSYGRGDHHLDPTSTSRDPGAPSHRHRESVPGAALRSASQHCRHVVEVDRGHARPPVTGRVTW